MGSELISGLDQGGAALEGDQFSGLVEVAAVVIQGKAPARPIERQEKVCSSWIRTPQP